LSLRTRFHQAEIDAIFREYDQCHSPGVAVGISLGGKTVYRKGFGLADLGLPVVLTPSMRMSLGSVTKHVTALAFMLLCEEGRASIDDTVGDHLREFSGAVREAKVRDLLSHTSGLRDSNDIVYQFSGYGRWVSAAQLVGAYQGFVDACGESRLRFNYNNGGYNLVAAVVEAASGMPLEAFFKERIFSPVGMHDTFLRRWDTDFYPNCARQHYRRPDGRFVEAHYGLEGFGQGGLVSSVDDLLRWLRHMDDPVVGSAETWSLMRTPGRLASGESTGYGFGVMVDRYRGATILSQPGNVMGGNAQTLKVPDVGLDVVVVANRSDANSRSLASRVVDACVEGLEEARPQPHEGPFSGRFRSPSSGRVIELYERGGSLIAHIDGFPIEFARADSHMLVPTPFWSFFKLKLELIGEPGVVSAVVFHDTGTADRLEALPAQASVSPPAGLYRGVGIDARLEFRETATGHRLRTHGAFGSLDYPVWSLGGAVFRASSTEESWDGGVITIDRGGDALRFSTARNPNMPFVR
jgi:D-aminopeptidase